MVSLYGLKSELFVAMNRRGRLYATVGMHIIPYPLITHAKMIFQYPAVHQYSVSVCVCGQALMIIN